MNFSTRELAIIYNIMISLGLKEMELEKEIVLDNSSPRLLLTYDTEKNTFKIELKENIWK